MPIDRYFIAPYDKDSGLQTNYKPFAIPDTAFAQLRNAWVFRGRARKRFGSTWLGDTQLSTRLRMTIGTADGSGNLSFVTLPGATLNPGALFSVGTIVFTVTTVPGSVGNAVTLSTDAVAIGTVRLDSTGPNVYQFQLSGSQASVAGLTVYWYPALPVMGFVTYGNAVVNSEPVYAFDTQFAYAYAGGWDRLAGFLNAAGEAMWNGSNIQFFWGDTWTGTEAFNKVLFVTNNNPNEPYFMRTFFNNQWAAFNPVVDASSTKINGAAIIVTFKNRLLLFNTWEGSSQPGNNFTNRVRYSWTKSPLDAAAFRQDLNNGNAVDAPTTESIVTVEFVKDRLIVFFERSTWELVYTGNQIYPFVWQKINTELGADSTFSVVPFDKVALAIGQNGIHACNGSNVDRIDENIPQLVFDILAANQGTQRVFGIRDFYTETAYFTYPGLVSNTSFPYPNNVLVYNYVNNTWGVNDDSITAFGYYQEQSPGILWSSTQVTWSDNITWGSPTQQPLFRQVIAGNQEGWTFIVNNEESQNAPALQITNLTVASGNIVTITAIDHNLRELEYVQLTGIVGSGNLTLLNGLNIQVQSDTFNLNTPNTFTFVYTGVPLTGTYAGGGIMARVSRPNILTKQYNFYQTDGRNAYISKVDFFVEATPSGQLLVNYYVSASDLSMVDASSIDGTNAIVGTSVLETSPYPSVTFEAFADRFWHPVYFQADGEYIQFQLTMNDAQMSNPTITDNPFEIHAICIHAQPTSYRLQ